MCRGPGTQPNRLPKPLIDGWCRWLVLEFTERVKEPSGDIRLMRPAGVLEPMAVLHSSYGFRFCPRACPVALRTELEEREGGGERDKIAAPGVMDWAAQSPSGGQRLGGGVQVGVLPARGGSHRLCARC